MWSNRTGVAEWGRRGVSRERLPNFFLIYSVVPASPHTNNSRTIWELALLGCLGNISTVSRLCKQKCVSYFSFIQILVLMLQINKQINKIYLLQY